MSVAIKNTVDGFHCQHDKGKTVHELLNTWKHCTSDLPASDVTVRNIACELSNLLVKQKVLKHCQHSWKHFPRCQNLHLMKMLYAQKYIVHCIEEKRELYMNLSR